MAGLAVTRSPDVLEAYLIKSKALEDLAEPFADYDWGLQMCMTRGSNNPIFSLILNDFSAIYSAMGQWYFTSARSRRASAAYYQDLRKQIHRGRAAVEQSVRKAMAESIDIWRRLKQKNKGRVLTMDLSQIDQPFDLIVIGGGITGAGILREAVRKGFRALLLEKNDFAWGTSSRSSKLVHGGLRYLKTGQFSLTRTSVRERQRLLHEAPGLVDPMGFLVPVYRTHGPGRWALEVGLTLYDLIAGRRQHRFFEPAAFKALVPRINTEGLLGGFRFEDAQTDDARLVIRLISDAGATGAKALNYTTARHLLRNGRGRITGVLAADTETGLEREIFAQAVINATGCWAETLHPSPQPGRHLRPLRGSHLVFSERTLPIDQGLSFSHPADGRAVFMVPWERAVLVGTTDLDHDPALNIEPAISSHETDYLLEGLNTVFPGMSLTRGHCMAAFAGVRPVLSRGNRPPSEESREHVVWVDNGLVTVTGGKLTTFRRLAWDALTAARPFLPPVEPTPRAPAFDRPPPVPSSCAVNPAVFRRLAGRYGEKAPGIIQGAAAEDLEAIPGTNTLWAELPHAAGEQIRHLSDLLLRRVRMGITAPDGGQAFLERIQRLCRPHLPWDDHRWRQEIEDYRRLRQRHYTCPGSESPPAGRAVSDGLPKGASGSVPK